MSKLASSDPRIAPKEMIITRTKSAQQKRTLRDKDRSMLRTTQLVKPPQRKSNDKSGKRKKQMSTSPKKLNNSCEKSIVVSDDECKEYYPNKLRRKFEEKKVFLKPHYESKLVVKLNKRKMKTPHRDGSIEGTAPKVCSTDLSSDYTQPEPSFTDLSMEEVVRMVDETDSLDDEDLMEILTCPSPVWWEDPPGESYLEDAIFKRAPDEAPNPTENPQNEREKDVPDNTKTKSSNKTEAEVTDFAQIAKKDDQFLKKRSKLENLLGNIKNSKTVSETNLNNCTNFGKEIKATKQIYEHVRNENNQLNNDTNTNQYLNATKDKEIVEKVSNKNRKQKRDSDSATSFTDIGFNEDLLKDLENMDIPIESSCKSKNVDDISEIELKPTNEVNKKYKNTVECNKKHIETKNVNKKPNKTNEINIKSDIKDLTDIGSDSNRSIIEKTSCKTESLSKEDDKNNMEIQKTSCKDGSLSKSVPLNMPRLTKRPKFKLEQSPTVKSISDVELSSPENIDTISDTNIRFIIDEDLETNLYDQKHRDVITKELNVENKTDSTKEVISTLNDKKEFITVYKIVSNDSKQNKYKNIPEYSNYVENLKRIEESSNEDSKCSGQLNSFFKKCKNANRKKRKEVETRDAETTNESKETSFCDTCGPKKSITVAQDENVKYCLNCSSIFDTDECSYCLNSKCDGKDISQTENPT